MSLCEEEEGARRGERRQIEKRTGRRRRGRGHIYRPAVDGDDDGGGGGSGNGR